MILLRSVIFVYYSPDSVFHPSIFFFKGLKKYIFYSAFWLHSFLQSSLISFIILFSFLQNIFGCRLLVESPRPAVSYSLKLWQLLHSVPQVFHFFHSCFSSKTRKTASDTISWWIVSSPLECYQLTLSSLESQQHRSLSILLAAEYLEPKTVPAIRQYLSKMNTIPWQSTLVMT